MTVTPSSATRLAGGRALIVPLNSPWGWASPGPTALALPSRPAAIA